MACREGVGNELLRSGSFHRGEQEPLQIHPVDEMGDVMKREPEPTVAHFACQATEGGVAVQEEPAFRERRGRRLRRDGDRARKLRIGRGPIDAVAENRSPHTPAAQLRW